MIKIRRHGEAGSRDFYKPENPASGGIFPIHGFTGPRDSSNQTPVIHGWSNPIHTNPTNQTHPGPWG